MNQVGAQLKVPDKAHDRLQTLLEQVVVLLSTLLDGLQLLLEVHVIEALHEGEQVGENNLCVIVEGDQPQSHFAHRVEGIRDLVSLVLNCRLNTLEQRQQVLVEQRVQS